MIKSKKQMYMVLGIFALVLFLGSTTYAFFNYTRTGTSNVIRTGRIYFNATQSGTLNVENLFPMSSEDAAEANLAAVSVRIEGDTNYSAGEEYKVSIVGVNNVVNNKTIPISYIAEYNPTDYEEQNSEDVIGTESGTYYVSRGQSSPLYTLNDSGVASEGATVLVGYIPNGATGIDGTLKISAYIDIDSVGISDTYPSGTVRTVITNGYSSSNCETALDGVTNASTYCASAAALQGAIDNGDLTEAEIGLLVSEGIVDEYTNGTPSSFGENRTILTTTEWNELQNSETPLSFKIRTESNEGVWVPNPGSATMSLSPDSGTITLANETTTSSTITTNGDGALTCSSDDDTVATCGIVGKTLTITGVTAGTATITVTEAPGTKFLTAATATYDVTVE